ncbi:heterokaryon incompatibility protein-domain-containing protein [Bisporella sp. PMI_857]|nr:heterokaryon incompatibility protein-domain-containing protein [Bisporella sp. PMI_857]
MRLLHAETKKLFEFFDKQIPKYAILSHTWGVEEVTFQEMQAFPRLCETKAGWLKIINCCRLALTQGLQYVWVDTCCIDKSSSSELSEAINSMFNYYRTAQICCVYLADVHTNAISQRDSFDAEFSGSRWFTRGWTLQELLAPRSVWFYNSRWQRRIVSKVTGIRREFLIGINSQRHFAKASIAEKMSWAASRQTIRTEDMAYCLFGIFGVNMPLLYGEGERAFSRLQSEIIKTSGDHSFLAYQYGQLLNSSSKFKNNPGRLGVDII